MDMTTKFTLALRRHIKDKGIRLDRGGGSRRTQSIIRLSSADTRQPLLVLWAKYSTRRLGSQGYFWGLNQNQLQSLNNQSYPWWLVLLFGTREGIYLATKGQANGHIDRREWSCQTLRPEYKIHEKDIKGEFQRCDKFSDVFQALRLSASPC
jgi:hypothetical protein